MLAKATAASAGVPLLYCSGSDFVEVFVGRGAARVRGLFERATKLAPCIIFIDELDALGKSRDFGSGSSNSGGFFPRSGGSSNDEAEQTLNQLLTCMDGLDSTRRICVLAATNRKEVLDPALIRPGRFDRIVTLTLPNVLGREAILRVHCQKLPGFVEYRPKGGGGCGGTGGKTFNHIHGYSDDDDDPVDDPTMAGKAVDLSVVAALTEGLSGAELESLVNEAAIRAVRRVTAEMAQQQQSQPQQQVGDSTTTATTTPPVIVPRVQASDFDESIENFFATRRRGLRPMAPWGIPITTAGGRSGGKSGNQNNTGGDWIRNWLG